MAELGKKFQGYFKNISMKFCFAILLLHESHRSYPSSRSMKNIDDGEKKKRKEKEKERMSFLVATT